MTYKRVKTRAKINLTLDVLRKREDGYHEVEMIMQSIDLYDELEFKVTEGEITIRCDHPEVPEYEGNIVYTIAKMLKKDFRVEKGIDIRIHKNIPVAAGLAGGSTNGAGALSALNELWGLHIEPSQLMDLGKRVGADIPFCLRGGTAVARGIGEKLEPLEALPATWMVLIKPELSISTPWVYSNLVLDRLDKRPGTREAIRAINHGRIEEAIPHLHNVLEEVTIAAYPEIKEIKNHLENLGVKKALMSGSGPSVFGLCESYQQAENIYELVKDHYKDAFLVKTYNKQ